MSLRKRGYQESETRSNSDGDTYYDVNLSDDVDQDEEPGKTKKERRAFNSEYNDAIRVWLGENYKNKKGIEIEKSDILANYLEEAKKRGWILKNATTIGRLVGEVFGKLKTREVMRNKVKSYYYVDLALKNDDEEEIEDDDVVDHNTCHGINFMVQPGTKIFVNENNRLLYKTYTGAPKKAFRITLNLTRDQKNKKWDGTFVYGVSSEQNVLSTAYTVLCNVIKKLKNPKLEMKTGCSYRWWIKKLNKFFRWSETVHTDLVVDSYQLAKYLTWYLRGLKGWKGIGTTKPLESDKMFDMFKQELIASLEAAKLKFAKIDDSCAQDLHICPHGQCMKTFTIPHKYRRHVKECSEIGKPGFEEDAEEYDDDENLLDDDDTQELPEVKAEEENMPSDDLSVVLRIVRGLDLARLEVAGDVIRRRIDELRRNDII